MVNGAVNGRLMVLLGGSIDEAAIYPALLCV